MKNTHDILARRYAQACINLFGDELTIELAERLSALAEAIKAQRSLLVYAGLKDTAEESKKQLEELFRVAGFGDMFVPLIDLVAEDKRLTLLPWIFHMIYVLYLERQGIMHFTIESAVELTKKEREAFVAYLEKKTEKEIRYTLTVNPALIAGVKMYSDTLGFEHSVQQRLYELSPTT